MSRRIPHYDGDKLLREVPEEEMPPDLRAVYLRGGEEVSDPAQADEVVPIVKVVRRYTDDAGNEVAEAEATKSVIRMYDAEGRVRRQTILVRTYPS